MTTQEITAKTLLGDLVPDTDNVLAKYIEPIFMDADVAASLINLGQAAFNNILMDSLTAVGGKVGDLTARNKDKAFALSEKSLKELTTSLGTSSSAGLIRIERSSTKPGFVVSIPLQHDTARMFHTGYIKTKGAEFPSPKGAFVDWNSEDKHAKDTVVKAFIHLVGEKQAMTALAMNRSMSVTIRRPDILKAGNLFNPSSIEGGADVATHLKNYLLGFSLTSPPIANTQQFYGELKAPLSKDSHYPTLKDVVSKNELWSHVLGTRSFMVYLDIFVPLNVAKYVTQTVNGEPTKSQLAMWFMLWMQGEFGEGGVGSAYAITSLSAIRASTKDAPSTKARCVNDVGLSVDSDGMPMFLPDHDDIDGYDKAWADLGEQADGSYCLKDSRKLGGNQFTFGETREDKKENIRFFPANQPIFTDWANFKFNYSSTGGFPEVEDFENWLAMTPTHAMNLMDFKLFETQHKNGSRRGKTYASLIDYTFRNKLPVLNLSPYAYFDKYIEKDILTTEQIIQLRRGIGDIITYINSSWPNVIQSSRVEGLAESFNWEHLSFKSIFDGEFPGIRWLGYLLSDYAKAVTSATPELLTKLIAQRSVMNSLAELGLMAMLGHYGSDIATNKALDLASRANYINPKRNENHHVLIPHQRF